MFCSLHTHSLFCDGTCSLEEMARAAADAGLVSFGFSGHAPAVYDYAAMSDADAENYLVEIARLKKKFAGRLELYTGMENDALHPFDRSRLDYCIGSVHFIRDDAGVIHCIEGRPEAFAGAVQAMGSVQAVVDRYCETVQQHLLTCKPDIAGHLDIIARPNADGSLFDVQSDWYRRAEERLAEAAAQSGCIVEVNTSGLRTARQEPFPSRRVLSLLRQADIPVIITADAHRASDVAAGFDQAAALLRSLGFQSAMILQHGRYIPEEL